MRRAAKVDANQGIIVSAFRAMGCPVLDLHRVGEDVPDLLVRIAGQNHFIEVKDGSLPPSARRLSEGQRAFANIWATVVIESADQAIAMVNRLRRGTFEYLGRIL